MNVAFHALVGIALSQEAGARVGGRRSPVVLTWTVAGLLAIGSHGILDALPHYYPLASWEDAIVSIALVSAWCLLLPGWMRGPLLLVCVAALLPDIIDHGPDDLRKHLGIRLPVLPNLFPWHWPAGSGSWRGRSGPNWIVSLVNHLIVLTFSVVAIVRTRHLFRSPWGHPGSKG